MSRIRANRITNQNADGAPVFPNGIVVTGVVTATTLNPSVGGDLSIADKIVHTGDTNTALRFPAADTITAETNGSEKIRITGLGLVGINETTPDSKVDIVYSSSTDTATQNLIHLRTDPSGSYATRGLFIKVGRDGAYDNSSVHYDIVGSSGNSGVHIFEVQGSEKLRITSSGKIKLGSGGDVVGSANVEIRYDNPVLLIRDTAESSANGDAKIAFGNNTHHPTAYISHIWDGNDGSLTFHTRVGGNEAERLRIASSGQIGLGGANYGTNTSTYNSRTNKSSQALVSNGGSAAPTWGYTNRPAFMARKSSTQNITTGTWTKVQLDEEILDTDNAYDNTTNHRFTVPTGGAGWYMCHFSAGIDDIQNGDYVYARLYRNGSSINHAIGMDWGVVTNQIVQANSSHMIHLDDGEYLELFVYHQEGSTEPVEQNRCYFGAFRLNI